MRALHSIKGIGVMCFSLLLVACAGGEPEPPPTPPPSPPPPPAPTYLLGGIVSGLTGSGFALRNGAEETNVAASGSFVFPTRLANGAAYDVVVARQPTNPEQTCTVSNGQGTINGADYDRVDVRCVLNSFRIGGTVNGASGSLVLQNNGIDDLTVNAFGAFTFAMPLRTGDAYNVTVKDHPHNQMCAVSAGTGTVANADVTNVVVDCAAIPPPATFTVGGSVSGLRGTRLLLQDQFGGMLSITTDGPFTTATALPNGVSYSVVVEPNAGQPTNPWQTCTVLNGSGVINNAPVTDIAVNCVTNSYTLTIDATHLEGLGLLVSDGRGNTHSLIDSNSLAVVSIPSGEDYWVQIVAQPTAPWQTCQVSGNERGTMTVFNIYKEIYCTTNRYTVGGAVIGLSSGSRLVLRNNDAEELAIIGTGQDMPFTFTDEIESLDYYNILVTESPTNQICDVSPPSGQVTDHDIADIVVTCTTPPANSFPVGGTVTGLESSLVLRNNGGDDLTVGADGSFTFSTPVSTGFDYHVTVATQPSRPEQECTVTNDRGKVASAPVTNVRVACVTKTYTVGGTITGLTGQRLKLKLNATPHDVEATLEVDAPTTVFTFATSVAGGTDYDVTVETLPTLPAQTCSVTNGSGTVAGANVNNISIQCTELLTTRKLALGWRHACALLSDQRVKCWGDNLYGQLGYGDQRSRGGNANDMGNALGHVDLGSNRLMKSIVSGAFHTCAILDDDTVKCWGRNNQGQLGLGDQVTRGDQQNEMGDRLNAVSLGDGRTATAIAAGRYHTCALLDDASVKCWGDNKQGQLGQGDKNPRGYPASTMGNALLPIDLGTNRTATEIAAGGDTTCVLLDDASVKCFGANSQGQLGLGDNQSRGDDTDEKGDQLLRVPLGTNRTAVAISVGDTHVCALLDDNTVKCWGHNYVGQLGQGDTRNRGDHPGEMDVALSPINLGVTFNPVAQVTAGGTHTCVTSLGRLKCFGGNDDGQLGTGDINPLGIASNQMGDALLPIDLGSDARVLDVASNFGVNCALLTDQRIKCWGGNTFGQLGLGDVRDRGDNLGEMGDALPYVDLGTQQ